MTTSQGGSGLDIVNIVGSGSVETEIDVEALAADLDAAEHDPETYHGAYLRFREDGPLTTIYRTGKYIITGSDSRDKLSETRNQVLTTLRDIGVLEKANDEWFTVQNYVCQGNLGEQVNLNTAAIGLGLDQTEYEPEQFPSLIYRPPEYECVLLLFGSGKVIVTGTPKLEQAEKAFRDLKSRLSEVI